MIGPVGLVETQGSRTAAPAGPGENPGPAASEIRPASRTSPDRRIKDLDFGVNLDRDRIESGPGRVNLRALVKLAAAADRLGSRQGQLRLNPGPGLNRVFAGSGARTLPVMSMVAIVTCWEGIQFPLQIVVNIGIDSPSCCHR